MRKKFLCTILSLVMLMSMCLPTYAKTPENFNETIQQVQVTENNSIELNIIELDEDILNSGNESKINEMITQKVSEQLETRGVTGVVPFIGRNGSTTQCNVYLAWGGLDEIYSHWRFKSLKITSNNLIFKDTYGTFGNGSTYTTYKATSQGYTGTVAIGTINIPTYVTTVRGDVDNLQGYSLTSAEWQSFFTTSGTISIN